MDVLYIHARIELFCGAYARSSLRDPGEGDIVVKTSKLVRTASCLVCRVRPRGIPPVIQHSVCSHSSTQNNKIGVGGFEIMPNEEGSFLFRMIAPGSSYYLYRQGMQEPASPKTKRKGLRLGKVSSEYVRPVLMATKCKMLGSRSCFGQHLSKQQSVSRHSRGANVVEYRISWRTFQIWQTSLILDKSWRDFRRRAEANKFCCVGISRASLSISQ